MGGLAAEGKQQAYCFGLRNIRYASANGVAMTVRQNAIAARSTRIGRMVFIN